MVERWMARLKNYDKCVFGVDGGRMGSQALESMDF
jgi:hypothetical protein